MGEIVNLREVRKRRTREKDRQAASARAARHGLTRAERMLEEARRAREVRELEAHRRGSDPPET